MGGPQSRVEKRGLNQEAREAESPPLTPRANGPPGGSAVALRALGCRRSLGETRHGCVGLGGAPTQGRSWM